VEGVFGFPVGAAVCGLDSAGAGPGFLGCAAGRAAMGRAELASEDVLLGAAAAGRSASEIGAAAGFGERCAGGAVRSAADPFAVALLACGAADGRSTAGLGGRTADRGCACSAAFGRDAATARSAIAGCVRTKSGASSSSSMTTSS